MSFVSLHRSILRASASRRAVRCLHATMLRHQQILDADSETFRQAVSSPARSVVLADFYADWCSPCKMLSPVLFKLTADDTVRTGSGRTLDLVTVDTDVQSELAAEYSIRALPTVVAFKDGQPIDRFVGALDEAGVRNFIQRI